MRHGLPRRFIGPLAAIVGLVLAACGGGAAAPTATPAASTAAAATATASPTPRPPADEVTIQLTFSIRGGLASLAVAEKQGYFKDENINVKFATGKGSLTVMSSVPADGNVFVFGPDTAAAQAISTGVPIVSVATYQTATPIGIIARPGVKLTTVKDLEGKKLGLVTGDTFQRLWPSIAQKNGVDTSKVTVVSMASSARTTAFLNGDVDAVSVLLDNEGPLLQAEFTEKLATLSGADMGFPLLGDGVAVHQNLVKNKPDLVKRFLAAVQRGYVDAQAKPGLAADSALALWSDALPKREVASQQIGVTLATDKTSHVAGKPYGYVEASQWASTLDLLKSTDSIKERLPTEKYFTNEYLPEPPK